MYLFLNSTDAAREQNSSALPNSPVVADIGRAPRRTLIADLAARITGRRPVRQNARTATMAGRSHELAA